MPSMRIVVNTRLLLSNKLEGIGWFTHETMMRIVKAHPEHRFIFLFDRAFHPKFIYADNVEGAVLFPPTRHPLLYRIWFDWLLPRKLKALKGPLQGHCSCTFIVELLQVHGPVERARGACVGAGWNSCFTRVERCDGIAFGPLYGQTFEPLELGVVAAINRINDHRTTWRFEHDDIAVSVQLRTWLPIDGSQAAHGIHGDGHDLRW